MSDQPWYHRGLRFQCTGCGQCCTGAPGFVWVNKADIEALAAAVGLEVARLEQEYVRRVGIRKSLVELSGGDCVFFDPQTRRCKVYHARPRQCRSWPFWQSNVRTPSDWARTCEVCPGSGLGPIVPREEIDVRVAALRV
jgi:Fe-S-cluster containining protein